MEPFEPPGPENLFLKAIWNNIIQILSGLLVLVLVIVRWNEIDPEVRTGIFVMVFVYFMIRYSVAYQSHRFEQEIEEQKKGKPKEDEYDKLLRE